MAKNFKIIKTLTVSYLVKLRKTRRPFINLHLCEMHFEIDQPNQICRNLITFAIMLLTLNTKPHLANTKVTLAKKKQVFF